MLYIQIGNNLKQKGHAVETTQMEISTRNSLVKTANGVENINDEKWSYLLDEKSQRAILKTDANVFKIKTNKQVKVASYN